MGQSANGAATEGQTDTAGSKVMQNSPHPPLYPGRPRNFVTEIARLSALRRRSGTASSAVFHKVGRNRVSRLTDTVIEFIRRYLPPLHWIIIRILALMLYWYARAVRATAEIVTVGSCRWPDFPPGSVLAVWHGSAPSLLVAFNARRPAMPVKLMVSRDGRGDCVALFCRWLGFEIVRGDAEHGGWKALMKIASEARGDGAALISPDGGGPPLFARVGAVALASASGMSLIPIGAACRPSVFERHKWDEARNPVPYGRIAIACGEPLRFPPFENPASLEEARQQLQEALGRAADEARAALGLPRSIHSRC